MPLLGTDGFQTEQWGVGVGGLSSPLNSSQWKTFTAPLPQCV